MKGIQELVIVVYGGRGGGEGRRGKGDDIHSSAQDLCCTVVPKQQCLTKCGWRLSWTAHVPDYAGVDWRIASVVVWQPPRLRVV